MNFFAKLGHFMVFVVLTVFTIGLYPLYFMVSTTRENNYFLRRLVEIEEAKTNKVLS